MNKQAREIGFNLIRQNQNAARMPPRPVHIELKMQKATTTDTSPGPPKPRNLKEKKKVGPHHGVSNLGTRTKTAAVSNHSQRTRVNLLCMDQRPYFVTYIILFPWSSPMTPQLWRRLVHRTTSIPGTSWHGTLIISGLDVLFPDSTASHCFWSNPSCVKTHLRLDIRTSRETKCAICHFVLTRQF